MERLDATPENLKEISNVLRQPVLGAFLMLYPPHGTLVKGELKLYFGIHSLFLSVIKSAPASNWTLNREKFSDWKGKILKYNTATVYDGVKHRAVSKDLKHKQVQLTNITEGVVEFSAELIDPAVNFVCDLISKQRAAADWTGGVDLSNFQGG